MLVGVSSPPNHDRGPIYMQQALAAMHAANREKLPVIFLFARHGETVGLFCRYPRALRAAVDAPLVAKYPTVKFERLDDNALDEKPADHRIFVAELRLRPEVFPIRRHAEFEDAMNKAAADPMGGILEILTPGSDDPTRAKIEVHVAPVDRHDRRAKRVRWTVEQLARRAFREHFHLATLFALAATSRWMVFRFCARVLVLFAGRREEVLSTDELTTSPGRSHDREDDVQAASDKVGHHLFDVQVRLTVSAPAEAEDRALKTLRAMAGAFGPFTSKRRVAFQLSRIRTHRTPPQRWRWRGFLLSDEELATLWHPTTEHIRAQRMKTSEFTELEPPASLPLRKNDSDLALLGRVKYRSRREPFGIKGEDRRRHVAIIGKTGMGKSTLLLNLVSSDIRSGRGVALIDPHGDLAEAVLQTIPQHRTNEVVLFDAGDRDFPLAYNPLTCRDPLQRDLIASGVVSAFKKLYGDSWGPRLEYILFNTLLTLTHVPGTTLLSVMRVLSDAKFRRDLVARVADPVVRSFWQLEFEKYHDRLRMEAVAPIQNKVGQFLSNPLSRAIVGQAKSSLDLRDVIDEGRIFIVNLSKGRVGEEPSTLLGALLVTGLQLAAMSRADQALADRRDFQLYVDEFQNFATESFATILSEARKYRLNLTIANQYLAQIEEATLHAVFGNVGSLLCFQVGTQDAEMLAEELGSDLAPEDLIRLPRYTAYARLLIDGMPSRPFSMETLPPATPAKRSTTDAIRTASRRRYARPRERVETEITQALSA